MILPTPITANALLSALAPSDLALLVPHFRGTAYEVGQTIQEAEAPVEQVWFPLSGMIALGIVTLSGTIVETAVVGCEGVVGALVGLGALKAFCRAVVVIQGHGVAISALRFREIAGGSESIRNLVLNYKEALLSQAQQTAACNAMHSLDQRLARWLLQTLDRVQGKTVVLTQELIGELLGVRRTSVTAAAQELERKRFIRYGRANIEILDREGLESVACECYACIRRRETDFARAIGQSKVASTTVS